MISSSFVRARKSPWIETDGERSATRSPPSGLVRARGLKLEFLDMKGVEVSSGLVRARGLKLVFLILAAVLIVRARKSPWIETIPKGMDIDAYTSGLVRARGLKPDSGGF